MNYTLMHKNIPVADISIYEKSGSTAAHNTDYLLSVFTLKTA